MKFFRNPEVLRDVLISILIIIILSVGVGFIAGWENTILVIVEGIAFAVLHFWSEWKRYKKIAKMGQELDQILHDDSAMLLQDYQEGELAILHTQLNKLVMKLQEQTENLQEDKVFLADSLADISHQVKTPLTSIHLLLSFLREEEVLPKQRQEIAREIAGLLERIDWLVYALLKMSRLDAGVVRMMKEPIVLEELAKKSYELVAVSMDIRGIQWKCDIQEESAFEGDLSWSIEALGNILKNCIEHTPAGGWIQLSGIENAIYTEIQIRDNGSGIAPEDLPHLFERFYRGKENDSQSVGIGLSLAQKIILQQNGTVQVKNAEEGGAVFTIRFYKTVV